MKKTLTALFIILIFSLLLSTPLLKKDFYTVHDDQQFARLFVFDSALKSGQFPVRWVEGLGFGFGYPLFNFYPPLVYWIGDTFHLTGASYIDSIKIVFYISILLSGLAMYVLVKDLWGRLPGVTSALFYMFVPYRALDIYVRGALAESFSFVWLPLILWSFLKLQQTGRLSYLISSSIFLSLLMITHNLIFLPFMLFLPIYLAFLIMVSPNKKQSTVHSLQSTVLALGLSAFFWMPALFEKGFTIVDQLLLVNLASYNIHFVYPQQLWNWPWGFGGSAPGLADGISFKIGKLHVLISIVALVMALISFAKNKSSSKLPIIFFLLFVFSAFMTTYYSKFLWNIIPPLGYLQFPWRFLTFTSLFSSILAGYFVYSLKVPTIKLLAGIVLIILLAIPNYKLFKPQAYRADLTDQVIMSQDYVSWYVSSSSFEYLPTGVELIKNDLGANEVNIERSQIPKSREEILNGTAQISQLANKPHDLIFSTRSSSDLEIRINNFNFPGWTAVVDGHEVKIEDNNPLKLITLNIPEGEHQVRVFFKNTPIRSVANMISLVSISLTIILIYKYGRKSSRS